MITKSARAEQTVVLVSETLCQCKRFATLQSDLNSTPVLRKHRQSRHNVRVHAARRGCGIRSG